MEFHISSQLKKSEFPPLKNQDFRQEYQIIYFESSGKVFVNIIGFKHAYVPNFFLKKIQNRNFHKTMHVPGF